MPPKLCSVWVFAPLLLSSIWGVRAADVPGADASTFECEVAPAGDAPEALFREIELGAYRVEALARDCRAALLDEAVLNARRHLAAWRKVVEELSVIGGNLRSLAAGQHILSVSQRRAWLDLEDISLQIQQQANETVHKLEESTLGVQAEQYIRALLDTQDRSLRMARIVAALDHCGELRMLPDTRVQFEKPQWSVRVHPHVWE